MANKDKKSGFSVILLSQLAILLLGVVLFLWAGIVLPKSRIGVGVSAIGGVGLAVFTFGFFLLIYRYGGTLARELANDIRRVSGLFVGYSWGQIVLVAALAGIGEELLFRVFLQGWLSGFVNIGWAILLSSLVFGFLHYLSFSYFISILIMSIIFGLVYYLSGSLLLVMVWHGVYDLIALVVLTKYTHLINKGGVL